MKKGKGLLLLGFGAVLLFSFIWQQPTEQVEPIHSLATVLQSIEGMGRVKIYMHEQGAEQSLNFFQSTPERTSANGILIVCEGADDLQVRKQLYEAIESVMGIPSHRIVILPMKKEDVQ